MSDLFLKKSVKNNNNLDLTESSFNLDKILNISSHKNNKNSITSSAMPNNIEFSETSYNRSQVGSGESVTSSAVFNNNTNFSATSYNDSQIGGESVTSSAVFNNNSNFSATSYSDLQIGGESVTSSAVFSKNYDFSSTSNNRSKYNKSKIGNVTSSAIMQTINELSSTSFNESQIGGGSATNISKINSNDINNLLSMLTSESNSNSDTEMLENKLRKLLNQDGGNYTEEMNTEMLENKLQKILKKNNINQNGGSKQLFGLTGLAVAGSMLSNFSDTEEFNSKKIIGTSDSESNKKTIFKKNEVKNKPILNTTTELNSATLSDIINNNNLITNSVTNSVTPVEDRRVEEIMNGGNNPGMKAFRDISKLVSEKLNISNGPNAKKIAGQLQRDVKEKNVDITHDKLVAVAKNHLEQNINKYKKMV